MSNILVVEDMASPRKAMKILLKKQGHDVHEAPNGRDAINKLKENIFDLIVTDLKMSPVDGMQVLKETKRNFPNTEVILLTAFASVENSVNAMKLGAHDYLMKPFNVEEFLKSVKKALTKSQEIDQIDRIESENESIQFGNIVGQSKAMSQVFKAVTRVAETDCTILITGDSGTGKELVAHAIHNRSLRKENTMISINCGALPENLLESELFGHVRGAFTGAVKDRKGIFQEVEGGTIFLDEVGELSQQMQVKLLRVLQEGEIRRVGENRSIKVDARVIAATNKDLREEIARGHFRKDLYYRLNVIPIRLPSLAERKEDSPLLVHHFLEKCAIKMRKDIPHISDEAMATLLEYQWPGNVREMENLIERTIAFLNKQVIEPEDLLDDFSIPQNEKPEDMDFEGLPLEEIEKKIILRYLKSTSGNQKLTAELLGISTTTLWRKLKAYQMDVDVVV